MSSDLTDATLTQIRDTISRLQSPVPDLPALLTLLAAPLACIGLLPPRFRRYVNSPMADGGIGILRYIPPLQRALLNYVIPTWESVLVQEHSYELVEQYFCPDAISFASPAAGKVALYAYSTILSTPLKDFHVHLLAKLCKGYPIDVLHTVLFPVSGQSISSDRHSVSWEDCVRDIVATPAKVANYMGDRRDIPPVLEHGVYLTDVSIRTENLIAVFASKRSQDIKGSIAYLLAKLVNVGVFPPSLPASPAQPSFFQTTLPTVRARVASSDDGQQYSTYWASLLASLPSSLSLRSILISLVSSLTTAKNPLDPSVKARALFKREAQLLKWLLGSLSKGNTELSECFGAVALGRNWDEGYARIFACWAAGAQNETRSREGLDILLAKVVDMWTDADHVRHSLLSQHRYVTSLLLLTVASFPSPSPALDLALSPPFVRSVSTYISHLDPSVRRCGMLVAEEVARAAGKTLDFGDWDGDDQGKTWCRQLRELIKGCDADAEELVEEEIQCTPSLGEGVPIKASTSGGQTSKKTVIEVNASGYDSDDSLTGYASPASSRSASPTPSELEEIEKDPTLRVGIKKVPRPVYLAQLGEMIRSTSGTQGGDEQETATKHEVALEVAEQLIRRKSGYGTELEENAVNLVYGFIGLQDNYDLEGFVGQRQAALIALVACCPRKGAPTIIEQFFTNQYSADQRFVMLNALALGARELASLPVPEVQGRQSEKASFPSKRLPSALHQRYVTSGDHLSTSNPVQLLLEGISQLALEKGKDATEEKVPDFVRERNLRVRPSAKITELSPTASASSARTALIQQLAGSVSRHPKLTSFTDVAAEYFICPLINRFWVFLRDEQTREARTAHQSLLHQYRGAGTGLVLSALILGRMLETITVLVHAARNAREWLAVIAPDALELALTLGTRPVSRGEGVDEDADEKGNDAGGPAESQKSKDAALLTAALELALVVLDGCLDMDGGRSLGLEHSPLLLGTGEWGGKVFGSLEDGAKVLGGGGSQEMRLRRAAAGVVLKVDELTSRWKRSMIEYM